MQSISLAPLVDFLSPFITVLLQAIIGVAITVVTLQIQKWTGVQVSQNALDKLRAAATTQAGILVAASETNLAGKVITTSHPSVVASANWIMANLPDAAAAVGATPAVLSNIITGEIGKLQAGSPASVTTTAPATP